MRIRDTWTGRVGIIMAVAGSAVGLGNFLRFPVQAVENGGGAFMIPYLVALLFLAIPLCWVEWAMGRAAGSAGHGSGPGIFNFFAPSRAARWFGALGILIPLLIYLYYIYIESWCLAFAFFALSGDLSKAVEADQVAGFLTSYQGVGSTDWFSNMSVAFIFFLITFAMNFFVVYLGVRRGIELVTKIATPILIALGIFIAYHVITLGAPDPAKPDWSSLRGFGFLWNPDLSALLNAKVWLAAAGQVFFTASVGLGLIITYASYLKKNDDIALSSLSAISINEFLEVIIGASIAIPAAYIFFGPSGAADIAASGGFNLGFVTMPIIFWKMPLSAFLAFFWFFLLFLAGVTSSISMLQPAIAFFEDELGWSRKKSVSVLFAFTFLASQPAIWFLAKGVLDTLDFWAGTFLVVIFAFGEALLFGWFFGAEDGFKEIQRSAAIKVPMIFKYIIKYVTPLYLGVILLVWLYQNGGSLIPSTSSPNFRYEVATLVGMALVFIILIALVEIADRRGAFSARAQKGGSR